MQGIQLTFEDSKHYIEYINLPISDNLKNSIDELVNNTGVSIPPINITDNWISEWHISLNEWFNSASLCFQKGILLVIDYALEASRYYHSSRSQGTLLSYSNHSANRFSLNKINLWS